MTGENMTCWVAGDGDTLRVEWRRTQQRGGMEPLPNADRETVERCLAKLGRLGFRAVDTPSDATT